MSFASILRAIVSECGGGVGAVLMGADGIPIEPDVERTIGHIKMARALPPAIENYIRCAKPIQGKTQLLIDAMGAGEYYGSNVNGDYFPEDALRHKGSDYGHETFMHYAYPFKHHVNKDPARAYGEKVTLSAYDPVMHRVLLIVRIDDSKCSDILNDLANGHYWDVSMGCKVPWDECSICRNRAKNRREYCPHLRYQMNKILPDGRRVFAYNHLPKFFDISFVTIGAEKASHILKKVASPAIGPTALHGHIKSSAVAAEVFYGKAAEDKRADIEKDVPSQPAAGVSGVTRKDRVRLNQHMDAAGALKSCEPPLPADRECLIRRLPRPRLTRSGWVTPPASSPAIRSAMACGSRWSSPMPSITPLTKLSISSMRRWVRRR